MAAAQHNIVVGRGEDFAFTLTIKDSVGERVDVSGDTFKAQVRTQGGKPLICEFTIDAEELGEEGVIICTLPQTETLKLDGNARYQWDLFRIEANTDSVSRLIAGDVRVENNITYF